MPSHDFSTEEEVRSPEEERIHVVILGAGASLASFPKGERNGLRLPVVKNFVQTLGLESLLRAHGVAPPYEDFEGIYSDIAVDPAKVELQQNLEKSVYDYFVSLDLPDEPTLYDHLVLSLRAKDVIATFNWDPFLWQAAARNFQFSKPPKLLFLHGNVATGYCPTCKVVFRRGQICPTCLKTVTSSPILYPVKQKNYQTDPAIAAHWRTLTRALKSAWTITLFGYGAPKTNIEAIRLLESGWGDPENRSMEETEIIDVLSEDELTSRWNRFIHSHHYRVHPSFYDSFIAKHPRRSCEALWQQVSMTRFVDEVDFPKHLDFQALYAWLQPRVSAE